MRDKCFVLVFFPPLFYYIYFWIGTTYFYFLYGTFLKITARGVMSFFFFFYLLEITVIAVILNYYPSTWYNVRLQDHFKIFLGLLFFYLLFTNNREKIHEFFCGKIKYKFLFSSSRLRFNVIKIKI